MKAYKKLATLAPVAVLSTSILFSPAMTFAAEQAPTAKQTTQQSAVQQDRTIQGYLIKNGVKTPVYKGGLITNQAAQASDAPYPELSSNPNDAIPNAGATHAENGSVGSVLYFKQIDLNNLGAGIGNSQKDYVYVEKKGDSGYVLGNYNPLTLQRTKIKDYDKSSELAGKMDGYFKSTITRDTFFSKIGSGVVPKNAAYTFSQAVTSGLTTSDAIGGALTLGYKVSVTEGGGIFPAAASEEFSAQLSVTYNHTITVSSQVTNTQTLGITKAADGYQYDKYVGAVYQLHSKYTFKPSDELQLAMNSPFGYKVILDQRAQSFQYDDSTLYLAVTPGAGK